MKNYHYLLLSIVFAFSTQACERYLISESVENSKDFVENEIHYLVSASMPSDKSVPETKVVLEGDSPSAPIVSKWQGSTSDFQDSFAILGYDRDGNIARVTNAVRLANETEDSITGTFEFSIDKDYWIEDLEYRYFYPFYPIRDYDLEYYTGSDDDNDNWVYKFSEQSGRFEDLTNNLFMTGPQIDLEDPSVEFQYGIAVLRLSNLCIPDLRDHSVSNIKVKSNAIKDALSYRYSFKEYYAAGNEISITGGFTTNSSGVIEDNIYLVFYPSSESLDYLVISLESDGRKYSYEYSGGLTGFSAGKVYTLNGAELTYKDTSPDYDWYLNPISSNHYLISNAKDFLGFQKIVNGDEDALSFLGLENADKFESKTIDLVTGATIDLSEVLSPRESWIPIDGFKGIINGNGTTISNLYIDGSFHYMGAKIGLFASLENATINSLTVSGMISVNGCYNGYIGGLVADANQSSIINCSTSISLSHSGGYGNGVGGVVGRAQSSLIIGSSDTSSIQINTASGDSDYVGGVVGFSSSYSTLCACAHFESPVSVDARSYVGGVVGREHGDTRISACYKSGKITMGGQGGQIHGGGSTPAYPYVSSCYYTGSYSSLGGNAYYGIGRYPGDSFDYGTQRVTDEAGMMAACEDMNAVIAEWNTNNPTMQSSRRYYVENSQIVFK